MNISPRVPQKLQCYPLFAACLLASASTILVAAALADSVWQSRAVSEMVGWPGVCLLVVSFLCLIHSGALDDRQLTRTKWERALLGCSPKDTIETGESDVRDHPMRDRLLDG